MLAEDERSFHSQEGPGTDALTLTLISDAGLLRRWITHEVLPCLYRRNDASTPSAENLQTDRQTQTVAALLLIAQAIARLPRVRPADAMAAALAGIEVNTGLSTTALLRSCRTARSWRPYGISTGQRIL